MINMLIDIYSGIYSKVSYESGTTLEGIKIADVTSNYSLSSSSSDV